LHDDEVPVDEGLVQELVRSQFPKLAALPLHEVPSTGTDNVLYRLGRHLGVRIPRVGYAVQQVDREATWLPRLAPHLPAAVPAPVARGEPAAGYPFPWLVFGWIPGDDALAAPPENWPRLAADVAAFVSALEGLDPGGAPAAGYRGGPLAPHDEMVRRVVAHLDGVVDVACATAVWDEALAAGPWAGRPVWVHGDLLPGNVVVRAGALAGVIDWGAAGVGDPACEAMLAWAMPPAARVIFRREVAFDDATWARGRGWALQQAVTFIPYYERTIPDGVAAAHRRLDALLTGDEPGRRGRSAGRKDGAGDPEPPGTVHLSSGRTEVHRRGEVVVRRAGPWAPAVHALLRHLETVGFAGSPRVIGDGFDTDGREVLSYIEGEPVHPRAWSDEGISALGSLLRHLHEAVASFVAPPGARWQPWFTRSDRPDAITGHGDLGPWNIVARDGLPVGFIDWEFAGPVDRLDEVAQVAWLNAQLHDDDVARRNDLPPAGERAHQLALFVDAYGLGPRERAQLVTRMIEHAIRDAANELTDSGGLRVAKLPAPPGGVPDLPPDWALTWRVRSAAWLVRHRPLLDVALGVG
jgi:aminoglycoside phosphotransferase (APT) family kinase protein